MSKIFSVKDKDMKMDEKKSEVIEILQSNTDRRDQNKKIVEIDLGLNTMLFIVLILAMVFFGKQLISIALFVFVSFVIMSAAKPVVYWLIRKNISKGWALTLAYTFVIVLMLGLASAVLIPFVDQFGGLVNTLPKWAEDIANLIKNIKIGSFSINTQWITEMIANFLKEITTTNNFKNIAGVLSGAFGSITMLVTAIVFSIYLLWEHDSLLDILLVNIPSDEKRSRVKKLVLDTENKLGSWMLGQATISSIAGLVLGVFLAIMGVPFALPLGVIIALFDSVPSIGPTLAAIPAALIAFVVLGPIKAIIVLIVFVIYQQIENNLLIPKVMGNAVGIRPVVVMLGAIIFLILFGVWGALVAVPILVLGQILYDFYIDLQKLKAKGIV